MFAVGTMDAVVVFNHKSVAFNWTLLREKITSSVQLAVFLEVNEWKSPCLALQVTIPTPTLSVKLIYQK